MRALRSATFALVLCSACADSFLGPGPAQDHGAVFDELWREFDLHYSFFEFKHINWDSLGTHYRPLAVAARSNVELAGVLARMLGELDDVHVSLAPFGSSTSIRYQSRADTATTYFSPALVFARYVHAAQFNQTQHIRFGLATPDVGYLYLPDFRGTNWAAEMDTVLAQLSFARAIVVDVRDNAGGTYELAAALAGRFADRRRTFGYLRRRNGPGHGDFTPFMNETVEPAGARQFTGRVYVLANRRSFSTAENFILAMRSLPLVTVLGDTTAGASGAPIVRELSNGWTYQLSEWIEYTASHLVYEGLGLPPDVVVRTTLTDSQQGVDAVLERALTLAR